MNKKMKNLIIDYRRLMVIVFTILTNIGFAQNQNPIEYPKNTSPINTDVVKVQIGTKTKDLKVGYIVGDNNNFYLVPLPYVDDFEKNVLIKVGNTYKPIFNSDKTIAFPFGAESTLKIEFKNALGDETIKNTVINALKVQVPALANKQGKVINLSNISTQGTFLEFNTPIGIIRAEGVLPTSSFIKKEYSAFIQVKDLLGTFKEVIEGIKLSEVSMGINLSYTAFFAKRDYLLSAEFTESSLLSSLSEITSTSGTEKLLFIPMGGSGNETQELSRALSSYMNIQLIRFKESSGGNANNLSENIISEFINKNLSSYYEQIKLADEQDNTTVVFLLNNGISLKSTIGNIKKADFSFDKEKTFKDLTETSQAKAGSTGITLSVPKYFSFGFNGSNNTSSTTKREIFTTDIERIKKSFEGEIPVMTGISLNSIKNFSSAKTSGVYIEGKSDAEELPKISTIYLDFDTKKECEEDEVKKMAYNVLSQSIRWAQGENITMTANSADDLKKRVEYQYQVYDEQFFSDELKQRMNNSTHEKLNGFKTQYQYLMVHGELESIQSSGINDNGVNKEFRYKVKFRNRSNPINVYATWPNGQLMYDNFGQLIKARDNFGTAIFKTFKLTVIITPDCKIETWSLMLE